MYCRFARRLVRRKKTNIRHLRSFSRSARLASRSICNMNCSRRHNRGWPCTLAARQKRPYRLRSPMCVAGRPPKRKTGRTPAWRSTGTANRRYSNQWRGSAQFTRHGKESALGPRECPKVTVKRPKNEPDRRRVGRKKADLKEPPFAWDRIRRYS
jgi:hypothetical protein